MTSSNNKAASIYEGTNINAWGSFENIEETKLFDPIQIGSWSLRNRIAMAPMTRCFANHETGVVGADVVEYYRKRAADGVGFIITEGIVISPRAKGIREYQEFIHKNKLIRGSLLQRQYIKRAERLLLKYGMLDV